MFSLQILNTNCPECNFYVNIQSKAINWLNEPGKTNKLRSEDQYFDLSDFITKGLLYLEEVKQRILLRIYVRWQPLSSIASILGNL